jgi:hypothetical protein
MTRDEANRIITEVMGKCWHEPRLRKCVACRGTGDVGAWGDGPAVCPICKGEGVVMMRWKNPKFFTPEGFFTAWKWAKEQEWWPLFIRDFASEEYDLDVYAEEHVDNIIIYGLSLINPAIFPMKLATYLKKMRRG